MKILNTKIKSWRLPLLLLRRYIIINAWYSYYISNKFHLEECDKKVHVEVTVIATTSCSNRRLQNVLSNITYSPSHHQAAAPVIIIQSTFRTAPDLCKKFHSHYHLVATVIYIESLRSQICVCICAHILHNIQALVGEKK